uniref:Fibronectin type-III domain-containing protein n=1 Tax=Plectus sambesii TaxID=2011161 RepID=A0A914VWA9_9BILA
MKFLDQLSNTFQLCKDQKWDLGHSGGGPLICVFHLGTNLPMKMPSALVWVRIFLLGGCLHLGASAQQRSSSAFTHDGSPFTRLYTVAVSAPLPTEETTISSDDQPLWRPWEGLTGTSVKTPIVQQQDTAKPTGSQITVAPHTGAPLTAPDFTIKKHPDYPWAILHIFAPKEPFRLGYLEFRVNYTDLTTTDGSIPPGSYVINSESNDAFSVYGMHPGHDYKIVIVGKPIDQSKDWAILRTEHVTMDTVVPDFNGANASIEATMDSITLRAMKTPSALQDYFQIEYARLDPFLRYTPLTVTDIPEQRSIELYLGNLSPGRNYNISVTAVRGDLFSKPWQEIITTKPLMPRDIRMNDLHSTTVILEWKEPLQSGVDRYKVAYGPVNENSTLVKVNDIRETNVQLSEGLFPGKKFVFAVYSEKGAQVSDAATLEQTIKPLAPTDLQITPDFGQHMFRVDLMVPGSGASKSDSCGIELVSDVVEKIVLTSSVTTLADAARRRCTFLLALVPGRRYEMLAWTISENTTSNKLSNNTALRPAFSLKALGLELRHSERDNGVELHWPEGESAVAELNEIWGKLVGNDSLLHLRVDPVTQPTKWVEQSKQLEGSPAHRQPIKVSDLRRGACYKVQIYTVTKSGIVSANRTEEFMRIEPPSGNFSLQEVTRTSANLNIDLMTSSADLPDCNVRFKATDANGSVVNERTMPLASRAIPITLGNLTPYQKYICRADIVCGSPNDKADKECPVKVRSIAEYRFETNQDRPGPITNLTVTTINPFTVRLAWREPMDPNGRIIRYIVTVYPQDGLEAQWNVTVMAHEGGVSGQSIEAIVDKLVGGLTYQFDVRAMTEAGLGKPARAGFLNSEEAYKDGGPFTVKMPIWAPPKPQGTLEVLMNTVRVSDLTIRFSTELFSTRHGLLEKYAVIVVEVAATDSDFSTVFVDDLTNRTSTWGQVSRLPVWPAYVALESPIEHAKDFVPARTITEVIGVDERCAIDHLDVVCNGPLRPGRAYRIKIRLYTTPLLWTDSAYSELVVTGTCLLFD